MIAAEIILRRLAIEIPKYRYSCRTEKDLHRGLAQALDGCFLPYAREYIASEKERFDFFVGGRVVIEAKIDGSFAEAAQQVDRYCTLDVVEGVAIVTTQPWGLGRFKDGLRGKRFEIIHIMRQAF